MASAVATYQSWILACPGSLPTVWSSLFRMSVLNVAICSASVCIITLCGRRLSADRYAFPLELLIKPGLRGVVDCRVGSPGVPPLERLPIIARLRTIGHDGACGDAFSRIVPVPCSALRLC